MLFRLGGGVDYFLCPFFQDDSYITIDGGDGRRRREIMDLRK